jgi:hypothetical protein
MLAEFRPRSTELILDVADPASGEGGDLFQAPMLDVFQIEDEPLFGRQLLQGILNKPAGLLEFRRL